MKKTKKAKPSLSSKSNLDIREQLIAIGTRYFLREGSKSISVRKIAEEGKVNLGSFVYHFETKEKFIHELIRMNYESFLTKFNLELIQANQFSTETDRLQFLFRQMAKIEPEFSDFISRVFMETLQGNTYLMKIFAKNPPKHAIAIIEIIKAGQNKKEFRQDLAEYELMFFCMILTFIPQVLMRRLLVSGSAAPIKFILDRFLKPESFEKRLDIALKGIKYV